MILTTTGAVSQIRTGVRFRSLARRGMLHSETESVDYLRLAAGAELDPPGLPGRGREGVESAWLVVRGSGWVDGGSEPTPVGPGDVVLAPAGEPVGLRAADTDLEVVWLAVLPASASAVLPPRKPVA